VIASIVSTDDGYASAKGRDKLLELGMCDLSAENPTEAWGLMERIVAPQNLRAAYGRVMSNKGAPGIDGMSVEALGAHLRAQWPAIRERPLAGTYRSAAVRRHELPKPEWDPTFSEGSFGFRLGRSAHQAVARAREYYLDGAHGVVDLEKFFDRVNHDKLMALVESRVRCLIRRYLASGMIGGDVYVPRLEGTPQGGPLSPLLANLLLDELDRELTARGHSEGFCRCLKHICCLL